MTWNRAWDEGVSWQTELVTVPTNWLLSAQDVAEKVLRTLNDGVDDDHIQSLIRTAVTAAEEATGRAIAPATYAWVADRFPCEAIVLQRPPLREIVSVAYVDGDGAEQSLTTSPEQYVLQASGLYTKAKVTPLYGEVWPSTRCQMGAVRITYTAGYETLDAVPGDVLHGIYLMIGELYKIRSLSIQPQTTSVAAPLQLERFWRPVY
jgi:uncharacterized phiE125 gp8 family phage protein